MAIEIEKKYRLTSQQRQLISSRLPEIGAISEGEDFEENILFRGGRLELGHSVLRLRCLKDSSILTFKERIPSASGIKHQKEHETRVQDPESMKVILSSIGFSPWLVYEKRRQNWRLDNTEIALDELSFGLFMEIEGDEKSILEVERKLQIEDLRSEHQTYPELALKHGKRTGDIVEARLR